MFIVCIFCPFLTQTTTTTPTTRERELGEKNKNINESLKRDMAYHQAGEKRKGKWKLAKSRHRQKTLIKIFQLQGSRTDEINTEINLLMLESLCEKQWFAEFQRGLNGNFNLRENQFKYFEQHSIALANLSGITYHFHDARSSIEAMPVDIIMVL